MYINFVFDLNQKIKFIAK